MILLIRSSYYEFNVTSFICILLSPLSILNKLKLIKLLYNYTFDEEFNKLYKNEIFNILKKYNIETTIIPNSIHHKKNELDLKIDHILLFAIFTDIYNDKYNYFPVFINNIFNFKIDINMFMTIYIIERKLNRKKKKCFDYIIYNKKMYNKFIKYNLYSNKYNVMNDKIKSLKSYILYVYT